MEGSVQWLCLQRAHIIPHPHESWWDEPGRQAIGRTIA